MFETRVFETRVFETHWFEIALFDSPSPTNGTVRVTIEVARGGCIKRDASDRIDLLSPVPAPFNYGRIEGQTGGDGEPLDVVVLGPKLDRGTRVDLPVRGIVRFIDGSVPDDKWVCSPHPLRRRDVALVTGFFRVYALLKQTRDRLRGRPATSRYAGWQSGSVF